MPVTSHRSPGAMAMYSWKYVSYAVYKQRTYHYYEYLDHSLSTPDPDCCVIPQLRKLILNIFAFEHQMSVHK